MSSTTRKIAQSEWERHKDTIVELYRNKPLKDVRAEMQGQHGFDASSWQYEMQLKRWNIRKNATRREWQRYFAANKDQSVANSRGDGPGTNIAPVILSKSTASKMRASRWVPVSIVTPKSVPSPHAVLAPRVSESTWPSNEGYLSSVLSFDRPIMALRNIQPGYQPAVQNTVDSLHATASPQLLNEPTLTDDFTTDSLLGSPSQAFADVRTTPGLSLDFSCALLLQSLLCGLGNSDLAPFPLRGLPTVNNMAIVILQEIRQELPFALFEQSIQSRGIMLERSAGHTVLGGFAPRVVVGILSSKDQSMVRQTPDLQHFVHLLGTQVPGESSALVTDDQAFETKFARLLLSSMLNGFAGLDDIPMENILGLLNQFLVNKPFLDVLEQSPRYVSRTLAHNIFQAATKTRDTKVMNLLLNRTHLLDNETVGFRPPYMCTPVRAVVAAAAETGNAAYMRKLLARAVTSKEAYRDDRVDRVVLNFALKGSHQDIVQMLLEAGAIGSHIFLPGKSFKDLQVLHDFIASGAVCIASGQELAQNERSIVAVVLNEFPGFQFGDPDLQQFLRKCIDADTLDFFREVLQTLDLRTGSFDDCLLVAVELGHSNLVEYLVDMGANPFHDSVLRIAIPDKPDMLRLLMQQERRRQTMPKCIGAQVLEPLMGNCAGNAEALDELIRTGAINFARLEVLYGREITSDFRTAYYRWRLTPLGMAIQGVPGRSDSNMVAMRKFLDAGADPNGISKCNEYWTKGSALMTALMVAIETGLEDAVNMLLDYGADVNARPRIRTTRTALQFAAEIGNMDMVRLLLSRGADVNSSASSRGGATALQFAAMTGNCNMVAELLDRGAQLDALPSRIDGMWPLEGAAANGRLDMIRYLWELNVRAVAEGMFPDGFSERHCLRAMYLAREKSHLGCRDLISDLTGISVDRLETDEYGASWIAY